MRTAKEKLVKKLLDENAELKKCREAHRDYERQLSKLEKKTRLTAEEGVERNRLKKLKLAMKDRMEAISANIG